MICRTQLAALDHNSGANLPQAKTRKGKLRHKLVFPKQGNKWIVKKIKEKKDKKFLHTLVERVVECQQNKVNLSLPKIKKPPKNIASILRPDKDETIRAQVSRFNVLL